MVQLSQRYQLSVAFPNGDESKKWVELINKLCKRYDCKPAILVRIALKTLDRVDKSDAVIEV